MHNLFRRFLSCLCPTSRCKLSSYAKLHIRDLRVATACSGTDAPVMCWQVFAEVLAADIQGSFSVTHVFSSEREDSKQRFIKSAFPDIPALFRDCTQLQCSEVFDVAAGENRVASMDLDSLVAGFPCVDASKLNSACNTNDNKNVLLNSGLRTGSVYVALRAFVLKCIQANGHNMRLVVSENVPSRLQYA